MSLNEKLIMLRKEKGLSQRQLSKEMDVSNTTISYIESTRSNPTSDLVAKICKYFNVSADWFLGLKEERN